MKNPGVFLENYVLGRYLGEGAHSRVYLCEHKLTITRYAVKVLEKRLLKEGMQHRYLKEIKMVRRLCCPFIIYIQEYFEDEERIYVVMEYCQGQSLLESLNNKIRDK